MPYESNYLMLKYEVQTTTVLISSGARRSGGPYRPHRGGPTGGEEVEAILKSPPAKAHKQAHVHAHAHTQLLGTMSEDDGYSCRGGTSQV